MITIKNIKLENGIAGEHLASLVYTETGYDKETRLELMECRTSEYRASYIDLFYRIDNTPNLLLFKNIGCDPSLMKITFKRNFFADKSGYHARCKRIAQKYRRYGITYDFVYSFSDSEGIILSFINRMEKIHMNDDIRRKLVDSEMDINDTRRLVRRIIGENLAKRARLESKKADHIVAVAEFIGTKY